MPETDNRGPRLPGNILEQLPTPCLVVDLAAADRNISRLAEFARTHAISLRPHFKAHKCTQLMRRQMNAGSCTGVTCQTAWEAATLAHSGVRDILVSNEVVDRASLGHLAAAAATASVTVCVDSMTNARTLDEIATARDIYLGVLLEVDVGMGRCGMPWDSPVLLDIARFVASSGRLRMRGLQGYEGHASPQEDRSLRRTLVWQAAQALTAARATLASAGIDCQTISGSGTGTFDLAAETGVWTELQAGSYVLMDASYARLKLPFENALYCLSTVVSRRGPDVAILDAGLKALTVDKGMPRAITPGLRVLRLADEHAVAATSADLVVDIGAKVWLQPAHVDPAVNLHDALFVWDPGIGMLVWPVDGRRRTVEWRPD